MSSAAIKYLSARIPRRKCIGWSYIVTMTIAGSLTTVSAKVELTKSDGSEGILSFGMDINSEEDYSEHMPDHLKCDACRVLAMKLTEKFDAIHKKRPSIKEMPESEILDATDEVCNDKFESYGVKEVNMVKRLSGPGLETENVAGVLQGGGKWPRRLMQMCANYLGELGEEEIYKIYLKEKNLEDYLCRGPGLRGDCNRSDKKSSSKKQSIEKEEL